MSRLIPITVIILFLCMAISNAITIKDITIIPQTLEVGRKAEFVVAVDSDLKTIGMEGTVTSPDGSSTSFKFETFGNLYSYIFDSTAKEGIYRLDVVASDEKESATAFSKFEVVALPDTRTQFNTSISIAQDTFSIANMTKMDTETILHKINNISGMVQPKATMYVHGTEYQAGQMAKVWLQLLNSSGHDLTDAVCYLDIYTPSNTIFIERATMTNFNHDGIFYYDLQVPISEGVYPVIALCYHHAMLVLNTMTNITMINGTFDGGTISDTFTTDGNYLLTTETPLSSGNPRRYIADFKFGNKSMCNVSSLFLHGISISWTGKWNSIAGDPMSISIYNYTSNTWLTLFNTIVGSGTGLKSVANSVSLDNMTQAGFLNTTNNEVKLRFQDTNNTDTSSTGFDTDFVGIYCDQLGDPTWQEIRGSTEMHVSGSVSQTTNQFVRVDSCDGFTDGRCAFATNDAEYDFTEGELEDYLNVTALITRPNTHIIYNTPPSVDCTALYWIKLWNGTDWIDFTNYSHYCKLSSDNCEIDLKLDIVDIQEYKFWFKYDNYMKWEVEYTKSIADTYATLLPTYCANRNFTYSVPITNGTNISSDPITDFCHHAYDDLWWIDNFYNQSLNVTNAGDYSPYLAELRFYRQEIYDRYQFLASSLGVTSQVSLLNQIYTYLNSTIYPYLVQIYSRLLGIETKIDVLTNISNTSLQIMTQLNTTITSIRNDTHSILTEINTLNQTITIMNSTMSNLSGQIEASAQASQTNFNLTWQIISLMEQDENLTHSQMLSYLGTIDANINMSRAEMASMNQSISAAISNMNNLLSAQVGGVQNDTQALITMLNNLTISISSVNVNLTETNALITALANQVSQNQNMTQENITQLKDLIVGVNSSITTSIISVNDSVTILSNQSQAYYVNLTAQIAEMKEEVRTIENNTFVLINITMETESDVDWILEYLNISDARLQLSVEAPSTCLEGTNWLAKAQVRDRFNVIQNPTDDIYCNMTTDLWGESEMGFNWLEDKWFYLHNCNPSYTTFNWSVTCDYLS